MRTGKRSAILSGLVVTSLMATISIAGNVTLPHTFVAGTPAKAAEVNGNFEAVKTAVDNNFSLIGALQTAVTTLQSTVGTLTGRVTTVEEAGLPLGKPCSYPGGTGVLVSFAVKGEASPTVTCARSEGARFIDLGIVVFDKTTRLLWEKKTPAGTGGVHDVSTPYTWANASAPDGTAFTVFLSALNTVSKPACTYDGSNISCPVNAQPACFAGYCDWRLPEIDELRSLSTATACSSPSNCVVDPLFVPAATYTWSATTHQSNSAYAWYVNFENNGSSYDLKTRGPYYLRAVRGGR